MTEYLYHACPALLCALGLVCPARMAFSVARTWPSLSRCNATPHYHDRASLSCAHSLVATQCLAPWSRHRTLCRNMEDLMSWNSLSRRKVSSVATQFQATLSRHQILCHDISPLGLYPKLGRDKKYSIAT